jgi:hypothetical protein
VGRQLRADVLLGPVVRAPENALGEVFGCGSQETHDRIFAASPLAADDLQLLFDRGHAIVMSRASTAVPLPRQDTWHAPTQCVWQAAYTAGLVMCVLDSGWPVPDDLVEVWNWFEAGHWPAGFADHPADGSGNQLTFPRQLLVH